MFFAALVAGGSLKYGVEAVSAVIHRPEGQSIGNRACWKVEVASDAETVVMS
jgi:hypothetical protein